MVASSPPQRSIAAWSTPVHGYLYALDGATGRRYWSGYAGTNPSQEADHWIVTSPVVYHGIVFVTSSSDLFAFQVDSGKLRWSYIPVESPSLSGVVQPVVAAGLIVIGVPPWKVYAVNP